MRYFVQRHTAAAAWRPGLALIYSELGRTREARMEFDYLARHDFTDLPRDALWMASMTYLTDVCTFLGDTARAATLYHLLLPYAERAIVIGNAVACYGAMSRYLGTFATTLKHWDAPLSIRRRPGHEHPYGRQTLPGPYPAHLRHHAAGS